MTDLWLYAGYASMPARPLSPDLRESPEHLPMMVSDEVADLAARFGVPQMRTYNILADDYIYSYRWRGSSDRRAEVVFAIQMPTGRIWLHAKMHYPAHIYRLPTGGIHKDELVEEALLREVEEETGLTVKIVRFLAMLEYRFWHGPSMVPFMSYVFQVSSASGIPVCRAGEDISEFRAVYPAELGRVATNLRNIGGERRAWGQWRAPAHEVVYQSLSN